MREAGEVRDEEVLALGKAGRMREHYRDAFTLRELDELCEQLEQRLGRWAGTPPEDRRALLAEREALLEYADSLASRAPEELSPLLREEFARVTARWWATREALRGLR